MKGYLLYSYAVKVRFLLRVRSNVLEGNMVRRAAPTRALLVRLASPGPPLTGVLT